VLDDVRGIRPLPDLATIPKTVNVRRIRKKCGVSQTRFARRFGISVRTLQDWEQGRYQPDAIARAFLTMIDRDPERTAKALADE
jgi:putative transcriptional regulator